MIATRQLRIPITVVLVSIAVLAVRTNECSGQADTIISGAALAKDILKEIGNKVKGDTTARTDAVAESSGPDADDLGLRAAADADDLWGEKELNADTASETGGIDLGPNAGDPHAGWAELTVVKSGGGWIVANDSEGKPRKEARAYAWKDTTPVRGSNNMTAAAAAATFSSNGTIREKWTVSSALSGALGSDIGPGYGDSVLRLDPFDNVNMSGLATAAYIWPLDAFQLQDTIVGGQTMTMVTPPQSELVIGHSFLQLPSSPNFRARFINSTGRSPLLDGIVVENDLAADAFHGTVPFGVSDTADFTLAGGKIAMSSTMLPRGALSDRQVIEQYLLTRAVLPPDNAQTGYVPNVTMLALLGGDNDFPSLSELGQEGGFGAFDLSNFVGLAVETIGTLTDAANLALQTVGHPIQPLVAGANPGDSISVTMSYSDSDQVEATSENQITIDEPALIWNGGIGQWNQPNWTPGGGPPAPLENAVLMTSDSFVTLSTPVNVNMTTVIAGELFIAAAGNLNSDANLHTLGTLSGAGQLQGNLTNGGRLVPGDPAGPLTISGNYTQEFKGTIQIELDGTLPVPERDRLNVLGHMELNGGTLEVALAAGFTPFVGQFFDILNFSSVSGSFSTLHLPHGYYWNTSNLLTNGTIFVEAAAIPGDYNANRSVDAADYVLWRKMFGQTGAGLAADGNGNHVVDFGDYILWRGQFGNHFATASMAASANVPEHCSFLLLAVATLLAMLSRNSHLSRDNGR